MRKSLGAFKRGDEHRHQLGLAQEAVRVSKREVRQLQHDPQLSEASHMAQWSAGFYPGFDTLMKVAKEKFPGIHLSDLKAEDYTSQANSEVGIPVVEEEGIGLEMVAVTKKVVTEQGITSSIPAEVLATNSPSLVLKITLADP